MNLQSVDYWTSEHPFIDRFKTSTTWTASSQTAVGVGDVPLGANGYPTALPSGATMVSTQIDLDPVSAGTSRVYELTWDGTASISVLGGTILSSEPGKVVFQFNLDSDWSRIDVTGLNASDPLTAIHVVREDQVALFDAGEIFNPEFVDKSSEWSTLRFKDWNHIDSTSAATWDGRNTPDSASWANGNGVPIEVEVALANKTHTNMWIDIPTAADDDYVRHTLQYVHDNLDPGLTVKVEYSNEVWNWAYGQARYAMEQGDQLFGTDANHDGVINSNDPAEHVADGWMQFYGYRSAQVAEIAKGVFSDAPDRVDTVLETQTGYQGLEQSIFSGVAKAGDGQVSALFNNWAVATYFGYELDGNTAADQAVVLGWARSGEAGMAAAFHEMEYGGGGLSSGGSLADLATELDYQGNVARANGMSLVAYEGGAHLTAAAYDPSVQGEVSAFFQRLMDDPRMGDLYTKMAQEFQAAGGTELDVYNDTSPSSTYGDWGVLNSIYQDHSSRYDALVSIAAGNDDALEHTALDSFTLDGGQTGVAFTGTGAFVGTGNDLDNVIIGSLDGGNALRGLGGQDKMVAYAGDNYLQGGQGNDMLTVGVNAIGSGDGATPASTGFNRVYGGQDDDMIMMRGAGHSAVNGNMGNDLIEDTGSGDNTLRGGQGDDAIYGGSGHSVLMGDLGDDVIHVHGSVGEAATLTASQHINVVSGGDGSDTFDFSALGAGQAATFAGQVYYQEIADFQPGTDHLVLPVSPTNAGDVGTTSVIFATVHDAEVYAQTQLTANGGSHLVEALSVGSDANTFLFYAESGNGAAGQDEVAGLGIIHLDNVGPSQLSLADL